MSVRSLNRQIAPRGCPCRLLIGETVTPRCVVRSSLRVDADRAAAHRLAGIETLLDDRGERRRGEQHVVDVAASIRFGHAQQAPPGRVERFHAVIVADDEQPRRQAGDDLVAQALGGFGARGHAPARAAQPRIASSMADGHERRFGAGAIASADHAVARRRESAQQRERQAGDERPDDRGQPEQEVANECVTRRQNLDRYQASSESP